MKEILTKRLRLGALRQEDGKALIGIMTDPAVGKTYMVPELDTQEKRDALFERIRALSEADDRFVYGVFLKNRLIGLINEVDRNGAEIELGYVIDPAYHNRGCATETLSACIKALLDGGFSRVKAGAFSENGASLRVMEKCGMRRTGETETVEYRGENYLCVYCAVGAEGAKNEL